MFKEKSDEQNSTANIMGITQMGNKLELIGKLSFHVFQIYERRHFQLDHILMYFLSDIGLSQRTSPHFILNHGAGFKRPNVYHYSSSHL